MTGIATVTSQAPWANFVQTTITHDDARGRGAEPVHGDAPAPAGLRGFAASGAPCPAWESVNAVNTPIT